MSVLAINQSCPYILIILIAWLNEAWDTDHLYVPWLYLLLEPFFFLFFLEGWGGVWIVL